MRMYFYNSNTNKWTWKDIKKYASTSENTTPHTFILIGSPENEIFYYSSYQDSVMQSNFADDIYPTFSFNDTLACVRSDEKSVLFNALNCTIHEKDFNFNYTGLGTGSAAFFNPVDKTMYGYSILSNKWTTNTVQEELYVCYNREYIGLISVWLNGKANGKYYAFNGLADSWVELTPEGISVSNVVGKRSALVVRSTHVYAFDPYGSTTDIRTLPDDPITSGFILSQNYPNPFINLTNIEYKLSTPSRVILKIFNSLGQEVRTLVDEHKAPGEWHVTWDGTNGNNKPVSSGIYNYQLQVGNAKANRSMILMR